MAKLNRRALLALGLGGALTALTTALWAAPRLLSGSITPAGKRRTRITLNADSHFEYRYFTLSNPDRLVIDMDGIVQNNALTSLAEQVRNHDAFISRVRLGQKNANTARIVFDLKHPIHAQISRNKNSLTIDLTPKNNIAPPPNTANKADTAAHHTPAPADDPLNDLLQQRQAAHNPPAANPQRKPVIVLDAGHGGKDPGAIGPTGVKEKDIALAYARETKKLLERKGYTVHMTRDNDTFIKLAERRKKAREVKADLFISIHANASENPAARGSDVFIWSVHANSERARKLAQAENDADYADGIPNVGNKNVDMILTDMMRTQTEIDSARLGNQMLNRFAQYNKLLQTRVDKGDFVVLRSLDIPSVLVELAFISNPQDEKLLVDSTFRRNMSNAMAESVSHYLKNTVLNPS